MSLVSIPSLFFVCAMFLSAEKNYIDDRTTNLVNSALAKFMYKNLLSPEMVSWEQFDH